MTIVKDDKKKYDLKVLTFHRFEVGLDLRQSTAARLGLSRVLHPAGSQRRLEVHGGLDEWIWLKNWEAFQAVAQK